MATGENSTTWGNVTNLNLGTAIEEAIAGSADVTFASANVTLTLTDTNASQTARNMRLRCTGTTGGSTRNLVVPAIEKAYMVQNDCADSVVVKNATGTGITVPAGKTMWVYNDGTNVVDAVTRLSSLTLGTALAVTDGGTGRTSLTAGYVLKGSGTSAISSGIIYDNGTNVGIGTASPAYTLDVIGDQRAAGLLTLKNDLLLDKGALDTIYCNTALAFARNGVGERMRIDSSGNVGVGTSSPTGGGGGTTLNVFGGSAASFRLSSSTDALDLFLAGGSGFVQTATAIPMVFRTNATERMRITDTGNVGIGTASPGQALDVVGNIRASSTLLAAAIQTGYGVSTGDCFVEIGGDRTGSGPSYVDFHSTSGTDFEARILRNSGANGGLDILNTGTGNMVVGQVGAGPLLLYTNNTTRMVIDSNGNVGIGTTNPLVSLEVNGSQITRGDANGFILFAPKEGTEPFGTDYDRFEIRVDDTAQVTTLGNTNGGTGSARALAFLAGTNERMRIDTAGNVGIGTASPTSKLDVQGQIGTGNITVRGDTSEGGQISLNDKNNTAATYNFDVDSGGHGRLFTTINNTNLTIGQLAGTGGNVVFTTANTERMRIDSSGNVGIGTSTPGQLLTVRYDHNGTTAALIQNRNASGSPAAALQFISGAFDLTDDRYAMIASAGGANNTLQFYTSQGATPTERFRIAANGAFGLSGTNYGTSGQVLTSQGSGSAPIWTSITSGTGTVTSVSFTGGIVSVGTPTTTPAFTVAGTSGGIPYFSSASTWATSAALAANAIVVGGGAGVAPSTITTGTGVVTALGVNTGTAGAFVVNGGALGTPSSGTLTNCTFPTLNQNTTGSAETLTTARTLTIGATGKTFNGSANVTWTLAELGAAASGANTDITSLATTTTINGVTIGYRSIPRSTTTTTAVVGDVGKCIAVTAGITIPNSTFAAGDALSIYNDSASAITITAGVTTLRQAGTANTGNRTLAARGMATVWFNSATEAIISGSGLT
jgi:hypothetical protein